MIAIYILLALAVFSSAEESASTDVTVETRFPTEECFDSAGTELCKIFEIACTDETQQKTATEQCAFTCRRC
ncbi:unnamed protein product [Auanema sp. JU1783]|nr:unnamed protein product [Auanema sp. JU1783]